MLWDVLLDRAEYDARRDPCSSYGLDEPKLPPPGAIIRPRAGELVIFRCDHPHAVSRIVRVHRCTEACFIGYRGEPSRLSYWS